MWIIPNLPEFSAYAAECLVSREGLADPALAIESSLTWRGKLSPLSTWYARWKRVWWIRHLFGRTLRPSTAGRFAIEYTASLAVIPARAKAAAGAVDWNETKDSFGRIYAKLSAQLTLFSVSSKTSTTTCPEASRLFLETYTAWVSRLRQEYTARSNAALLTTGSGCLHLRVPTSEKCGNVWPTPMASTATYQLSHGTKKLGLSKAVAYWPTPVAKDAERGMFLPHTLQKRMNHRRRVNLSEQIQRQQYYPTPTASEAEKAAQYTNQDSLTRMAKSGLLAQGEANTDGKLPEQLNPAWVAQLMGTTLESTFFGCTETE